MMTDRPPSPEAVSDEASLAEFFRRDAFPDAASLTIGEIRRPRGGMSWETFIVRLDIGRPYDEQRWVVIKRAPGDFGPLGPYNARKDAVIFQSLHGHVPVPRFVAHSSDPAVFERPFTAVELVEGESDDLYRIEKWPTWQQHREKLGRQIVAALAALHGFDWKGSSIAEVLGQPTTIRDRLQTMVSWYIEPFERPRDDVTVPQIFWRDLAVWLIDNAAEVPLEEQVVVHGDFRFGNMIWQGAKLAAIVDWERAMFGDPMANLGFLAMPMARRRRPELMGMAMTIEQLERWYLEATGTPVHRRRFQYYMIFWQFIEGSLGSQPPNERIRDHSPGGTDQAARRSVVGALKLGPNLHQMQTTRLIEAFDRGDHDVV